MVKTFLLHGSNAVLAAALAVCAALFTGGALRFSLWAAAAGAIVFSSSEYTTHRFLFHAPPAPLRWLSRLQHRLHYDHHIDPSDLRLLFLPLWFVLPAALLYFGIYLVLTHDGSLALSLTFGTLAALLYYEWVHYVAHVPFNPVTPIGKWMKKYHLWHHFKNERLWFGVTNPSMDALMGTYRRVEEAQRSSTTRDLWKAP